MLNTTDEYLLVQLISECCEVAHRATKALHFGLNDIQKGQNLTNNERLTQELTDLHATIELCHANNLLTNQPTRTDLIKKKERIQKYMTYARSIGELND